MGHKVLRLCYHKCGNKNLMRNKEREREREKQRKGKGISHLIVNLSFKNIFFFFFEDKK
jgi:hypothetical protein